MPTGTPDASLRVAFVDIENTGWTAGAHYYRNLFSALRHLDEQARPRIVVLVVSSKQRRGYETYRELADDIVVVPRPPRDRRVVRTARRLSRRVRGDAAERQRVERSLREHSVDAMFVSWSELGPLPRLPVLGWIHDFQHVHHPDFFSEAENRFRDTRFRRIAGECTRVVLSSEDARRDFEQFSPAFVHKARVLRFVAQVPHEVYDTDPASICAQYDLPERFFYLPNQFWVHKNHGVVIDALAELKTRRDDITVVCTGNPTDNRDPLYFARLLARVSQLGLRDNFVILGWVPHAHTFELMRQSVAVLQPSFFEGWSTTVEETKSVGKSIILSDIPIHREQAPAGALYFPHDDAAALAGRLVEASDTRRSGPDEELEAAARESLPARTRDYATTFVEIVRDALGERSA